MSIPGEQTGTQPKTEQGLSKWPPESDHIGSVLNQPYTTLSLTKLSDSPGSSVSSIK